MRLIRWRAANHLTLTQTAALFGMPATARGTLSKIERGEHIISTDVLERIYWTTFYIGPEPVTADDHLSAWRGNHPQLSQSLRAASRAAAGAFNRAAKKQETNNGSKKQRLREAGEEKRRGRR